MEMDKIGQYLFALGALIALVNGFMPGVVPSVGLILVVVGLVVGFMNISAGETHNFLLAAVAMIVAGGVGNLGSIPMVGTMLASIFWGFAAMMAPAALVVAVKSVWGMAKN